MRFRSGFANLVRWVVLPVLIAGLVTQAAPPVHADDPSVELNKQKDKLKYIQDKRTEAKNEYDRVYWQAQESEELLRQADNDLAVAKSQLAEITNQFRVAEDDLKKVEAEVKEAQQRFNKQKALLSTRIRAINEEGRVNYLAVLLGANTFSDFISRFDMLKIVVQKDSQLFDQVRKDKKDLEEKQQVATLRRDQLAALKVRAEETRVRVEAKRSERQVVSRTLDTRKRELQSLMDQWEQKEQEIQQMIADLQRRLNRRGGKFAPIYPVKNAVITDKFGMRINPITQKWTMHRGTDFAAGQGTPVMAIENGVVLLAGWSDVYGNYIIIDHGGGISSLYAHNSQLLVSENATVTQGQVIAKVGTTGWSTGPHCHLEIRVNGVAQDPMSYLPQ